MYRMGTWQWNALSFILFLPVMIDSLLAQRSGILHVQHLPKPPQDLRKRIAFVIRTLVQHVKQWSPRHLEHKLKPQYSITHASRSFPERKRFNHFPTNLVRSVSSVAAVLAKHVVNAAQREKWDPGRRAINTNTREYSSWVQPRSWKHHRTFWRTRRENGTMPSTNDLWAFQGMLANTYHGQTVWGRLKIFHALSPAGRSVGRERRLDS